MLAKIIHINKPLFVDQRGVILKILDLEDMNLNIRVNAVLRITHKKGSPPRGNHYHKKAYNLMYVEEGKIRYSEKPLSNSKTKITSVIMKKGDFIIIKPRILHAVEAIEDSVLWDFATESRNKKKYENDTVKVKLV